MKGSLAPLRYPAFRLLVIGRFVSLLGNSMAPIALAFAVLDITGSATDLGLVVGSRSVTNVAFLLFGGVVADRLPRRALVVAGSCLAFLTQGTLAALVLTGAATIPALMAISAVNGLTSAFALPATAALLPQTVPAQLRQPANAINRLGVNFSMIIGAAAGGVVVASFGPGWALAFDAFSFGAAALFFSQIRVPDVERAERAGDGAVRDTLRDLRVGWSAFISHTWVWVVVAGFCFFNMAEMAGIAVIGPTLADTSFGRQTWGLLMAVTTAGAVVGALVALRLRARRLLLVGVIGCAGPAAFILVLGAPISVAVLYAFAFISGLGVEQFGIAWETSLQEHIPGDKLARVYSYDALGSFIAIPIGEVAAGPIAQHLGARPALLIVGTVMVASIVGMLASRSVRGLIHPVQQIPHSEAVPATA